MSEEKGLAPYDPEPYEDLLEKYNDNKYLRALMQLLGGVTAGTSGAIDTMLSEASQKYRRNRLYAFFDALGQSNIDLTEDLIKKDDFLHAYFATARSAFNTRRKEKVQLLANLLAAFTKKKNLEDNVDRFEDNLSILDEISYQEFHALLILHELQLNNPVGERESDLALVNPIWKDFKQAAIKDAGVPEDEFNAFLTRLNRTGLYSTITGTYLSYSGNRGFVTPRFSRLLDDLR